MANAQHLDRLKQGVSTWNRWRAQARIRPDFVGADLAWMDLKGANLRDADLSWANLTHAVLAGANLHGVVLREAALDGADLTGANLRMANLTAARVGTADFSRVQLFDTVLADLDLASAKGLDSCRHSGPSILDHRTLARSGKLPVMFLRGCGLSEPLIAFAPTLAEQGLPPDCFISFSTHDQRFVDRLFKDLQTMGVRCWLAREEADGSRKWCIGVDQPLRPRERLLVVLSEHSLRSEWIEREVEACFLREGEEHRQIVHALRVDDGMTQTALGWPAQLYSSRSIIDFRAWSDRPAAYADGLERLVCQLLDTPTS